MKRIVEVSTPGTHLHLKNDCLTISQDRQVLASVPIEDLGTLILASPALTVTSALLGRLADLGGITVVSGADFQPEGVLLPLRAHTTRGERIRAQVTAKRPLEKQLWARLIRAKITNQAALIGDEDQSKRLLQLVEKVRSGDPGNTEAQAARLYWPLVFADGEEHFGGVPFRRGQAGAAWPNNLLNYGYAILRAMTARAICGSGLLPEVGVHHHNRYDAFALASDLMEPFRPWVDHCCQGLIHEGPGDLDRAAKQALLGIYDDPVLLDGEKTPLFIALGRAASSMAAAFLDGKKGLSAQEAAKRLVLPSFVPAP
jgi:CRISP-associated protein Cas1